MKQCLQRDGYFLRRLLVGSPRIAVTSASVIPLESGQADRSGLSNFTNLLNQGTRDEVVYAFIIGLQEYSQRLS